MAMVNIDPAAIPVWLSLSGTVIMAILMAFPKIANSLSTGTETLVGSARRTSSEKEAADITTMRREIKYLREQVFELHAHKDDRDDFIVDLQRWAFLVRTIAATEGINLPEPPKFHKELLENMKENANE